MLYKEVVKLKYNNKLFQMYIGPKNERFFLEIFSDGFYSYPTFEDLLGLEFIFANKNNDRYDVKNSNNQKNFIPKVIYKGIPIALGISLLLVPSADSLISINDIPSIQDIKEDLGIYSKDGVFPIKIDTYNSGIINNYYYAYDSDYLKNIFGSDLKITEAMLYDVIDTNPGIVDRYKDFIKEYCHLFITTYPNADLTVLYNNLLSLRVIECDSLDDLHTHTGSNESAACYMRSENTIYTLKNYNYAKGTWEYQFIMHELSHAARTYWRDIDGDGTFEYKVQFDGTHLRQLSVLEAMNSIFTVRMFDYEEKNIAYQLQSNYLSIILDSIDNYELSDYINHSMSYLASKIDEATGYVNYASVIFELIDTQYKDFHSSDIDIDETQYYPLYDFIADLYFNKNIKPGMSKNEMTLVCDDLVDRVMYGVSDGYHIDYNHFYVYLEEYIEKKELGNYSR